MKKFKSLIMIAVILMGCENQNMNVQNSGGVWYLKDGIFNADGTSKKAIIGS